MLSSCTLRVSLNVSARLAGLLLHSEIYWSGRFSCASLPGLFSKQSLPGCYPGSSIPVVSIQQVWVQLWEGQTLGLDL